MTRSDAQVQALRGMSSKCHKWSPNDYLGGQLPLIFAHGWWGGVGVGGCDGTCVDMLVFQRWFRSLAYK